MSDLIQFDDEPKSELLDFSTPDEGMPDAQVERERQLQELANIEPNADYKGIRNSLAQEHKDVEDEELYSDAERLLVSGADVNKVNEGLENYKNVYNSGDYQSSLEVEAGRERASKTLRDNDTTRINSLSEPMTYDADVEAAKQELEETFRQEVESYKATGSTWSKNMDNTMFGPLASTVISAADKFAPGFRSTVTSAEDIIANAIPGFTTVDTATIGDTGDISIKSRSIGLDQRNEYLYHRVYDTPEQFKQFLNERMKELQNSSPTAVDAYMNNVQGVIDTSNDWWNLVDLVDAAGAVRGVIKGLKGGYKSEVWAAKKIGDIAEADAKVVKAVEEGKDTATILEDAITNSASQPFQSQGMMAESSRIAGELADVVADKALQRRLDFAREVNKLSEEEAEVAKAVVRDNVKNDLETVNKSAVDVQAVDIVMNEDGGYNALISIGGGLDGKRGMTEKAANKLAHKLGLNVDEFAINKKDGMGFYIDVNRSLKADELLQIGIDAEIKTPGSLMRYFAGTLNISDKMHMKDITAFRAYEGLRAYFEETMKPFKKLSKKEKKAVSELYKRGQEANDGRGAWFDPRKLKEEGFSDKVVDFYMLMKKMSDTEYYINNAATRKRLVAEGYKVLNQDEIVKPVKVTQQSFRGMVIKDIDNFEQLEKELAKGKQVVAIHRTDIGQRRLQHTHKLIDPSADAINELPRYVTPYQAGGRREYTWGTAFVKMGTTLKEGVNGFARTLKAGSDKAALQAYADEVNKLIDIMKSTDNEIEQTAKILEADFKYLEGVDNAAEAKKLFKTDKNPDGFIDANHRAQVLEDGERYRYEGGINVYDGPENLNDALNDLIRMREETFNGRGVMLDQMNTRKGILVNYKDIWEHTILKAAHTATLSDLHSWYRKEFRRQFGDIIKNSSSMSDEEILRVNVDDLDLFSTRDLDKINAAKNYQQHYQRLTNAKTGLDKAIERSLDSVARWVGDKHLLGLDRESSVVKGLAKADPLNAARTYEAYRVLAGNASQIWKQPLDLLSTTIAHPIDAIRATVLAPVALRAMHLKHYGKDIGALKKLYGKALGVDLDRLADFMDGFATTKLVGKMDPVLRENSRSKVYKNFLTQTLMAPFNIGQGAVNVLTDVIAFLNKPHASFAEIAQHADDLTKNMTKVSESAMQYGQKFGVDKLFAQWTGYKTHSLEALFNKRMTKRERLAIGISNFVLLGGISNFGDKAATNFYQWAVKNTDFTPEEIEGMSWGFLHNAGKELGIDFNESLGVGDSIDKIFDLLDSDVDAQVKFGDIFPNIANMTNMVNPTSWNIVAWCKDLYRPETDAFDLYNLSEKYARDPASPVALKNMGRSYIMWKTGMYFNTKREPLDSAGYDLDKRQKWVYNSLLGIAPYERFVNNFEYNLNKIRNDIKRDALKDLKEIADRVHQYQEIHPEDTMRDKENIDKLLREYDSARRGFGEAFQEDFGSVFANEFYRDSWTIMNASKEAGEKLRQRTERYDIRMFNAIHGDKLNDRL